MKKKSQTRLRSRNCECNLENVVVCLKLCTVAIGQELVVEDRSTMDVIKVIEMTKSVSCCTVNGLLLATYS